MSTIASQKFQMRDGAPGPNSRSRSLRVEYLALSSLSSPFTPRTQEIRVTTYPNPARSSTLEASCLHRRHRAPTIQGIMMDTLTTLRLSPGRARALHGARRTNHPLVPSRKLLLDQISSVSCGREPDIEASFPIHSKQGL